MREIVTHHDGHGLMESITIEAGPDGPGGAAHEYVCYTDGTMGTGQATTSGRIEIARIRYQCGPRHESGSTPGILDGVLLAIIADRMEKFQAGPYSSREGAFVLTKVQEAMHWLKARADRRAREGTLGNNIPDSK
ncbi:MAG TPA: ABC transporter ATPase [Bacteroidota bacterium]|nr:ABC transporter ATPase [Bacteroidota bacterium]